MLKSFVMDRIEEDGNKLTPSPSSEPDKYHKIRAGMFLASVTGMSILGGFGMTLAMAKRQDPDMFARGIHGTREIPESGVSLATRALVRGSMYSVAGVSLFCFAVWKVMGVHSLAEFRQKVGSVMPKIPKKDNPGRGDFTTIRDLFNYIIEEDEKEKRAKKIS
ncbi:unnamed protein product [Candidula unifasciata]|uniref:Transmembrane protein 242 n=1 Tax=Candidula unifasciata TaxID=100452 RepID=A0A8S3Z455_9EUPU|nr:unnamed protein product [Candidula unifasciata]